MSFSNVIIHGTAADVATAVKRVTNINYLDEYGYTPLIETTIADDVEKAKIVLEAGADVNQRDMTAKSALHWAATNNNFELCKLLLEKGANANDYTIASEPILVKPLLRNNTELKHLLVEHGASYQFAYDFINAKLLGHRFELVGSVDIVDPSETFAEVDYEGFYLEFSINLIGHSLRAFRENFASRPILPWFSELDRIIRAFERGQALIQFDHYLKNYRSHLKEINPVLQADPVIIPIAQEGHAISLVRAGNLVAIVDRVQDNAPEDRLPIFYMNRSKNFNSDLCELIYRPQEIKEIMETLKSKLGLQQINHIPLHAQIIGNCSWANVEGCIAALYFMLKLNDEGNDVDQDSLIADGLELFSRWQQWDTERSLKFFMDGFRSATPSRKASIAAILAGIVFQTCSAENPEHVERARKILSIIKNSPYEYVLESYIKFYSHDRSTAAGKNFKRLLEIYDLTGDF